ncbi:atrial natriuretic peptide receptor 1-like [Littorina saxatilis]|uniref:atrial natriuretic peptide receptor 1-like n=1 Tax=Littorina saxatilis TaxID=31220 RepID=UPI0038B4C43E
MYLPAYLPSMYLPAYLSNAHQFCVYWAYTAFQNRMARGKLQASLHVLSFFVLFASNTCAVELNGAGASFPYDVYSAWMPAYKAHRRSFRTITMKYESIGSGGGKARIKVRPHVAYAGSDSLLKEEEYKAYPDLQMLPSIAGAIVMAYNMPGVSELRLSMAQLVGIYNGSLAYWNDTWLVSTNPQAALPAQRIHVAARRDKSGTTELFTAALSAEDDNWKNKYGTFSQGLDPDDVPHVWDGDVVTLYGETNRGVSGMILSTKFSIGYLVHSDAVTAKLPFAMLLNAAGNLVEARAESVQSAMDDFADSFSSRMTTSLARPPGAYSYPICGYTYLIIRMTSMTDCLVATELVRYIEWFYTDQIARVECENLYMVPLSRAVYTAVMETVVKHVLCHGANVYAMEQADKEEERLSLQTWRLPVYISAPIMAALLIILVLYLVRDQIRTNRALLRDEWRIPAQDIVFSDINEGSFAQRYYLNERQTNKIFLFLQVHPSMSTLDSTATTMKVEGGRVGRYKGGRVLVTELFTLTGPVTLRVKRGILTLREQARHANLTAFYGLSLHEDMHLYCSVSEFCSKGTLQHLLHGTKYNIDNQFKFALCLGVAKGLDYLHGQKLIHASLTSNKIYLDDNWSVKNCESDSIERLLFLFLMHLCEQVGGWEVHNMSALQGRSSVVTDMGVTEWAREEFWLAPEVLSHKSLPNMAADVYSFAIVVQETFSRDTPYSEQSAFMTPGEALEKVVCESLRPQFTPDTPLEAREVMQRAWEMDPSARPTMAAVLTMIKKACPKVRTVMDSMLDSLTQYVAQLEDTSHLVHGMLTDKTHTHQGPDTATRKQTVQMERTSLARALGDTDLTPQLLESVTVLVVCVHDMERLIRVSTPQEVVEFMSDLYQALDMTLSHRRYHDVIKVSVSNDTYTLAAGVTHRSSDHLQVMATLALDFLAMDTTFTIRHRREDRLRLRIGLGTGSVVVGLAGHDLLHFTMFGDAVSRAVNMAATCQPMGIQLNDVTHLTLSTFKYFTCVERKDTKDKHDVKHHASKTYWLIGHRDMTETYMPES